MAKWRTKFISKIFNNSSGKNNNENHTSQNNNDYFHNVVPPIVSGLDSSINNANANNDFNKIHDTKDSSVTSSFVIPLNENQQKPYSYEQNQNNQFNTASLISFKSNFKIPKVLSFEIRVEKIKQLLMILFSLVVITISSLFIGFYFSDLKLNFISHPVITIPLLMVSLTLLAINFIDFFSLKKEVNLYIEKTLKGSLIPPSFIIRNYRKIHGRLIIFNWLFTFCYIILGLITLFMYLLSGQKLTFLVQSWTVTVPNLKTEAITMSVILAVLFLIHLINIIFFRKRKSNIISYYGYEVINPVELESYKKKINRICLIVTIAFIAIIFFAIAIPTYFLRKKKKKS